MGEDRLAERVCWNAPMGQPNGLLSYRITIGDYMITIGDARATRIGKKSVGGKTRRDKRWMIQ